MDELSFGYPGEKFYPKSPGSFAAYRVPLPNPPVAPTVFADVPVALAVFTGVKGQEIELYVGIGPVSAPNNAGFKSRAYREILEDLVSLRCRLEQLRSEYAGWRP